ncbi:hypothetical protein [Citrobacter amalonaticus]
MHWTHDSGGYFEHELESGQIKTARSQRPQQAFGIILINDRTQLCQERCVFGVRRLAGQMINALQVRQIHRHVMRNLPGQKLTRDRQECLQRRLRDQPVTAVNTALLGKPEQETQFVSRDRGHAEGLAKNDFAVHLANGTLPVSHQGQIS